MSRIKFLSLLFFLLVFAFTGRAFAENDLIKKGDILTLDRCIDIAIKMNPNIGLAESTTKIYKSKIGETKSAYFPQFSITSGYNRQNPTGDYSGDYNMYNGSTSISQLLYDFGKTSTQSKIDKLNLVSSRSGVDNAVVQLAYNVKQAYYSALSSKLNENIYKKSIEEYQAHLKQAKAFFQIGTKSKIDVTTAEVNLSNAQLNYIKAEDAYKTAIVTLNNTLGLPNAPEYTIEDTLSYKKKTQAFNKDNTGKILNVSDKNPSLKNVNLKSNVEETNIVDSLAFKRFNITLEDAIKKAFDNRPDLKSLVTLENAAKASIKLAKTGYYPTLSGVANYGWGGKAFPLDSGWSFGANVSVPVFDGFLTHNKVNEAKANLDVASANKEILRQNIYLQVQQSYINMVDAEKSIPLAEITVKQAKENLELANGRYKIGVGSSVDVQDAETNYDNAQLSYVLAFYNYNTARSNLEKAMGVK